MKILMLCYEYPPLGGGGSRIVHGLSNELVKSGHEVHLVTMGYKNLPKLEVNGNLTVHRIPCIRRNISVSNTHELIVYVCAAIPYIYKLVKKKEFNINHTHFILPDGLISLIIKKLISLPYIITAHGSDVPGFNPDRFNLDHKLLTPVWKKIVINADNIVCLSNYLKSLILKKAPDANPILIPNAIDTNKFNPSRPKKDMILLVSRIFQRKGIQYFIQALESLEHNYEINIVGDGPYLNTLIELANELRVNINFRGWLDNNSQELKELFESAKIFVFTSKSENFSVVLLEAMTSGLAIITSNHDSCAQVVGDCAIYVNPDSPLDIRNALIKLIENPEFCDQLGKSARKRVEEKFNWPQIVKLYENQYSKYCLLPNPVNSNVK